jgi:predicted peptidase
MKNILHTLVFISLVFIVTGCNKEKASYDERIETKPPVLKENIVQVNSSIGGYYSALPVHYEKTTKRYPLLLFLHGAGQTGDGNKDLHKILYEGVPELLNQQAFPAHFKMNGTYYSFIVLAPQFNELPKVPTIHSFLEYAKQQYRIDESRVYISGLSAGGIATSDYGAAYPNQVAAIVPLSGVSLWFDLDTKAKSIAAGKLPVWAFHNSDDRSIPVNDVRMFLQLINDNHPAVKPKLTELLAFGIFNHDSWTVATDPAFKEDGENIYEWMLKHKR